MDKLTKNGQIGENAQKIVASTPIFVKKLLFSCWIWLFRLMSLLKPDHILLAS